MPAGIEVYNENGVLQFGITNRAFRVLTVADIGAVDSGSIPVDTTQGQLLVVPVVADAKFAPTVASGSGAVTWNYGSTPVSQRDSGARVQIACF